MRSTNQCSSSILGLPVLVARACLMRTHLTHGTQLPLQSPADRLAVQTPGSSKVVLTSNTPRKFNPGDAWRCRSLADHRPHRPPPSVPVPLRPMFSQGFRGFLSLISITQYSRQIGRRLQCALYCTCNFWYFHTVPAVECLVRPILRPTLSNLAGCAPRYLLGRLFWPMPSAQPCSPFFEQRNRRDVNRKRDPRLRSIISAPLRAPRPPGSDKVSPDFHSSSYAFSKMHYRPGDCAPDDLKPALPEILSSRRDRLYAPPFP